MATTEETPAPTVKEVPAPIPEFGRLSINIPTEWDKWLETEAKARLVGKALLVVRALELLKDELPPVP